jgi:hypothetical protein
MVIGPLRVTFENFKSMFAPVLFSVARNIGEDTSVLAPPNAIQLRKGPPRHKLA